MKKLELKQEEQLYVKKYMEYNYKFSPNFLDSGLEIPDCYFKFNNKYYSIEVTRYFQQNCEKKHIEFVNNIEKFLLKDDFLNQIYHRLGKQKSDDITIAFYNIEELKKTIIENIHIIENIKIGNSYYFNENENDYNDVICIGCNKDKMKITEFIDYVGEEILNEEHIELDLKIKNKYPLTISFKYCKLPYWGKSPNNKKVIPTFCWWENEDELYNNITNAIENKNNKLIKEYIPKLENHSIKYDYYNLVIYSEGIPAQLDEKKLYDKIIQIQNLNYNEIAIFLWNKIMIVNNNGFKIHNH